MTNFLPQIQSVISVTNLRSVMMMIRNMMMAMVVIIMEMKNVCPGHKQLTDMDIQDMLIPQTLKMGILNTFII